MAEQKQDDQLEHTFSNYVRIRDVVQKTCWRRWTIGKSGARGSGISVLPARHDDDDDDFIQHFSFICRIKWFQVLLCISNNLIRHQLIVYKQLDGQRVLFLTIQFNISDLFAHSLDIKHFYWTHKKDPISCYHSGSFCTWDKCQWRSTPYSPNVQGWSLTIRLVNAISRTFIVGKGYHSTVLDSNSWNHLNVCKQ